MTEIVDRGRRERLKAIKAEIIEVDRVAARAMWEWGTLFQEVEKDELWREDGSTSFSAWVDVETQHTHQFARSAIDVARHFTLEMAERWGCTKLEAALKYAALTKREELPGDILALQIRFREPDGQYSSMPFPEAPANLIRAANTQLAKDEAAREKRAQARGIDASVRVRAVNLAKGLPPAPKGTSRGDRVVVQKGTDGAFAVTFKAIPVSELRAFVAALNEHMLDAPEDEE